MKKVVVLLSGGMDSSVLATWHVAQGDDVRCLAVHYGQRHRKELEAARAHAERLRVPYVEVDLSCLASVLPGSSQTDPSVPVPTGHYTEEQMKLTVVPNRNMILLSVAVGHAIAHGCAGVSYAAHAGDHAIYPDCRPEFVDALNTAVEMCDWHPVTLMRPFIHRTKADIAALGISMGMDLSTTWSCYAGRELHCGRCGTCVERREAFHLAGAEDPTQYEAEAPTKEDLLAADWKP